MPRSPIPNITRLRRPREAVRAAALMPVLAAVVAAAAEARETGRDPEHCPAVRDLARRLGGIAATASSIKPRANAACACQTCPDREIAGSLDAAPQLAVRTHAGSLSEHAADLGSTMRQQLHAVAAELGLARHCYTIQCHSSRAASTPVIELAHDAFCVTVGAFGLFPGKEVACRRTADRLGTWAGPTITFDMGALADAARFAASLRCALDLPRAHCASAA